MDKLKSEQFLELWEAARLGRPRFRFIRTLLLPLGRSGWGNWSEVAMWTYKRPCLAHARAGEP